MALPAPEIAKALAQEPPGLALDLACGAGRHAIWLAERGWRVTAVDLEAPALARIQCFQNDLESQEFKIEPNAWDLIVCWLYWQPDLLPAIAYGVRPGGVAALACRTTGRFAASLAKLGGAFPDWTEIVSGENETRAYLIVRRPLEKPVD